MSAAGGWPASRVERVDVLLVLGVLLVDTVLLALVEMMFVTLQFAGVPTPLSGLVALVSTPWLVLRAGELPAGPLGAGLVLTCWMGTTGLLGFTGPGGDVLLPEGWPSLLLLAAGLLPGALALGRVICARRVAPVAGLFPGALALWRVIRARRAAPPDGQPGGRR